MKQGFKIFYIDLLDALPISMPATPKNNFQRINSPLPKTLFLDFNPASPAGGLSNNTINQPKHHQTKTFQEEYDEFIQVYRKTILPK